MIGWFQFSLSKSSIVAALIVFILLVFHFISQWPDNMESKQRPNTTFNTEQVSKQLQKQQVEALFALAEKYREDFSVAGEQAAEQASQSDSSKADTTDDDALSQVDIDGVKVKLLAIYTEAKQQVALFRYGASNTKYTPLKQGEHIEQLELAGISNSSALLRKETGEEYSLFLFKPQSSQTKAQ